MSALKIFLGLVMGMFLSRAFFLTVVMNSYYAGQAKGNRIERKIIDPSRGVILDRNGKILANNISVDDKTVRYYPDGEVFGGLVGYISDGVGVVGLEKQYDELLAGHKGEVIVEETARGVATSEVRRDAGRNGEELKTNIDQGIQTVAYRALKNHLAVTGISGSVVVAKVNGEVLALVSLPSFDPNLFISGGKRGAEGGIYTDTKSIVEDETRKPLFNRSVAGSFPPGSIFKLIPAIGALSEGVINKNDLIEDSGEIKVGDYRFGNWFFDKYGKTEGRINVVKALARSNDIFFYRIGEMLGADKLVDWSAKFGLGKKTAIDFPGEVAGLLPNPLWMEKTKGQRWFLGNTYHMSIGQGDLLATPIQMNRAVAAVVSGEWCAPQLKSAKSDCRSVGTSDESRQTIIEGMKEACMTGGTAFPFYSLKGRVICKTGTAQHGGETTKPHAWITVVVPSKNQNLEESKNQSDSVVITVMLEEAGEGSYEAGPVAREITDYLLR